MRINLLPICSASVTVPGSSTVTGWRCSSTTPATQIARPRRSMAACGSWPSATSPPARSFATTIACTMAETKRLRAIVVRESAAGQCTPAKSFVGENRWRRNKCNRNLLSNPEKRIPKKAGQLPPNALARLDQQPRKLAEKKSTKNGLCLRPLGQQLAARAIAQGSPGADGSKRPPDINRLGSYTPE